MSTQVFITYFTTRLNWEKSNNKEKQKNKKEKRKEKQKSQSKFQK